LPKIIKGQDKEECKGRKRKKERSVKVKEA
jgi:hypothetical protein